MYMSKQLLLLLIPTVLVSATYAQQPGDLDMSFGTDGFTTIDAQGQGLFDRGLTDFVATRWQSGFL